MSRASQPSARAATTDNAGRVCPYCRLTISLGTSVVDCPACRAVHHGDCWVDNGGCALLGCPAAPNGATPSASTRPLPPVGVRSPLVVSADWDPQPPPALHLPAPADASQPVTSTTVPGRHPRRALAIAVLAVAVAVAALAVALVLHKGASTADKSQGTNRNRSGLTTEASRSHPGPAVGTTSSQSALRRPTRGRARQTIRQLTRAQNQNAIVYVLEAYEAAYSAQNLVNLGALFTPEIIRHGLEAGGCGTTQGKAQVLSTYEAQFASGAENYRLTDLRPDLIAVSGRHARAPLAFDINTTSGAALGFAAFSLVDLHGRWLIQHIVASC